MTSRLSERASGVLAGSCVVLLVMLIVLLWTGVGTGMFDEADGGGGRTASTVRQEGAYTRLGGNRSRNATKGMEEFYARTSEDNHGNTIASTPKGVQLSISDEGDGREVQYVKPMKISSLPLHEDDRLYGPDQRPPSSEEDRDRQGGAFIVEDRSTEGAPPLRYHSGHFRHKMAPVWDPHPQYEFTAFDHRFHLDLSHDSGLVAPDLQVTNVWHNHTTLEHPGLEGQKCFYSGKIAGEPTSFVSVSLCGGMTGHIHSTSGNFFIEPAEKWRETGAATPILHAVYRSSDTFRHRSNHVQDTFDAGVPHCGVVDDAEMADPGPFSGQRRDSPPHFVGDSPPKFPGDRSKRSVYEELRGGSSRLKPGRRDLDFGQRREYSIEIMVVADKKMADYHGDGLNHYILSLMHTVNKFYKHASVGNPITIAVVKIMVLRDLEAEQNAKRKQGTLAPVYLHKFCNWQSKHNDENDGSAGHYDTALLLTREVLCRDIANPKCDTLGLAELGTMCHRNLSCSIVRDNGLSAAFTIAHELGHALNMPHDDDVRCKPFHSSAQNNNVMSRMLDNNTSPYSWSNCSRHFVTEFLDGGNGDCLLDEPFNNEVENTVPRDWLPGENFTEDKQCELVNGPGSTICSFMPVCSKLWCGMNLNEQKGCKTNHMPWADGTSCGDQRWCQQGDCIRRDRKQLVPVNGGWGDWQNYEACSRSCGGGVKRGMRYCDSPRNENGGQYCLGPKVRYKSCNMLECPAGSKDFREMQCAQHNGNNFKIHGLPDDVTWVPKYGGFNSKQRCTLYCRVSQSSDYYPLRNQVIDGTPCGPDTYDMCVNGMCKPAGCNHRLGFDDKLDFCGKCGGDNSSCHWINGHYNVSRYGYNRVVRIPAGSSNIDIRQTGHRDLKDANYLALVDPNSGEYLLNGKYSVTNYLKTIPYAGSKLQYSGSDSVVERLNSSLPINQDLVLEVLSVGKVDPPNISYKYTTMSVDSTGYRWATRDKWTECDKVCNGNRERVLACVRSEDGLEVPTDYCRDVDKPAAETEACNVYCTLTWQVWARSECSSHCGPGVRSVSLQCVQETHSDHRSSHVQESSCGHITKPGEEEDCEGPCDATHWTYKEWGPCSVTCGGGTTTRTATCVDELEREVERRLCEDEPPYDEMPCGRGHCPHWVTGDVWTPCSVSCGEGESQRAYYCQLDSRVVTAQSCYPQAIPEHRRTCNERQCQQITTTMQPPPTPSPTPPPTTTAAPRDLDNVIPYADSASNAIDPSAPRGGGGGGGGWKTGSWGECSRSCGGGQQRRQVKCQADGRHDRCLKHDRPKDNVQCNPEPCPSWKYGMWGECNASCGLGYRHRQVGCQSTLGEIIKDEACSAADRERHYEECEMPPCGAEKKGNKWKIGAWGTCSKTCGSGVRHRAVTCIAPDGRCDARARPKTARGCKHFPCPNSWVVSEWTECSVTCGTGVQRRSAVCNAVERNANARTDVCHGEGKPPEVQACQMPNCNSHFYWRASEWDPCSHPCGKKGRQIRQISCYHHSNKRVPKYNCHNESKPKRKRKCNQRKCTGEFSSCVDVQRKMGMREDGEYQLLLRGGRSATVYCHQMASEAPREFLTLPNERNNYAEIYDRRLLTPDSCPDGGMRRDSCDCALDAEGKAGLTVYKRIRLNITSFRVQTTDITFAHQVKGTKVAYAESGDCYSRASCPQGQFSIDLKETPFKVSRLTHWEGHGSEPSIDVKRAERDQRVFGKCGGYCGTCSPNAHHGLTLEWLQPP